MFRFADRWNESQRSQRSFPRLYDAEINLGVETKAFWTQVPYLIQNVCVPAHIVRNRITGICRYFVSKSVEGSREKLEWTAPLKSTREKVFAAWLKSERMISSLGVMAMSCKFLFVPKKICVHSWSQLWGMSSLTYVNISKSDIQRAW